MPSAERRMQNAERRLQNAECRMPNAERRPVYMQTIKTGLLTRWQGRPTSVSRSTERIGLNCCRTHDGSHARGHGHNT